MKKVLLVASQHGDEVLGEKLFSYIKKYRGSLLPMIDYIIANPEAHTHGVRFIESDMNRSFNTTPYTKEAILAQKLLSYIANADFELVLDLHTTSAPQPASVIITKLHTTTRQYLKGNPFQYVVQMPRSIAAHSLIGNCSQAISIEVNKSKVNDITLAMLTDSIEAFIKNIQFRASVEVFEVDALLTQDDIVNLQQNELQNFRRNRQGFIPILYGETSYQKTKNYIGFKANKKYRLTV